MTKRIVRQKFSQKYFSFTIHSHTFVECLPSGLIYLTPIRCNNVLHSCAKSIFRVHKYKPFLSRTASYLFIYSHTYLINLLTLSSQLIISFLFWFGDNDMKSQYSSYKINLSCFTTWRAWFSQNKMMKMRCIKTVSHNWSCFLAEWLSNDENVLTNLLNV